MHWGNEPECVSSHCTVWLPRYTQKEVGTFQDGSTLSRERLASSLRQVLSDVGVSMAQYSRHSFRISAATTEAKLGVPDSLIKKMG